MKNTNIPMDFLSRQNSRHHKIGNVFLVTEFQMTDNYEPSKQPLMIDLVAN